MVVVIKEDTKLLFEEFKNEMEKLSGVAALIDKKDLADKILQITSNDPVSKVIGYQSQYLTELGLKSTLENARRRVEWIPETKPDDFNYENYRRKLAKADFAITSCDYLVAQTGTLVFTGKNNPSRLITLLPPVVIVISKLSSFVADLVTLHNQLKVTGLNQQSSLIYFTGPSRTADIEKKLVLGVHGPKELTVLIMDK